jgi:hypothetical protein
MARRSGVPSQLFSSASLMAAPLQQYEPLQRARRHHAPVVTRNPMRPSNGSSPAGYARRGSRSLKRTAKKKTGDRCAKTVPSIDSWSCFFAVAYLLVGGIKIEWPAAETRQTVRATAIPTWAISNRSFDRPPGSRG